MIFPKKVKPLPKSNRQKSGQKKVFMEIWKERNHNCVVCGGYIPLPLSFVFAHIKSKGVHPELKFDPDNIGLVCPISCHTELDIRNSYKNDSP